MQQINENKNCLKNMPNLTNIQHIIAAIYLLQDIIVKEQIPTEEGILN